MKNNKNVTQQPKDRRKVWTIDINTLRIHVRIAINLTVQKEITKTLQNITETYLN